MVGTKFGIKRSHHIKPIYFTEMVLALNFGFASNRFSEVG
jgi:hypothetical protein